MNTRGMMYIIWIFPSNLVAKEAITSFQFHTVHSILLYWDTYIYNHTSKKGPILRPRNVTVQSTEYKKLFQIKIHLRVKIIGTTRVMYKNIN